MNRPRIRKVGIAIVVGFLGFAGLAFWAVWPKGYEVKVVNRTDGPMAGVRLEFVDGTRVELPALPPGQGASVWVSPDISHNIHLVYVQPDGLTNDAVHVRLPPGRDLIREDRTVLGVVGHMIGGKPSTTRCYVKRRQLWDPARFLPFAPGAGD